MTAGASSRHPTRHPEQRRTDTAQAEPGTRSTPDDAGPSARRSHHGAPRRAERHHRHADGVSNRQRLARKSEAALRRSLVRPARPRSGGVLLASAASRGRPRARQRSRGWKWAPAHSQPGEGRRSQDRRSAGAAAGPALRRGTDRPHRRRRRPRDRWRLRTAANGLRPASRPTDAFGVRGTGAQDLPRPPQRFGAAAARKGRTRRPRVRQTSQSSERVSARAPLGSSQPGHHGWHAERCPPTARFGALERGANQHVAVKVGGETAIRKGPRSPDGKRTRHQGPRKGPGATSTCSQTSHLRVRRDAVTARSATCTVRRQRRRQRASFGSSAADGGTVEAPWTGATDDLALDRASARTRRTSPARRPKV